MESAINSKVYTAIKVLLFIEKYGKKLQIEVYIKRKRKMERTTRFVERIRKIQKKAKHY